jgi:DNA-binding MarR family transcriptional regulator
MLTDPQLELPSFTFLSNHAHVLLAIARDNELRQRDIAHAVGITPGAVQRILDELVAAGYLRREKVGRRNRYEILRDRPLRHPLDGGHRIGELIDVLTA